MFDFVTRKYVGYGSLNSGLIRVAILTSVFGFEFVVANQLSGKLDTSLSRALSPELPVTSITIEPSLVYEIAENTSLNFYTLLNRPTDVYEKLAVPKTIVFMTRNFDLGSITLSPIVSTTLINLERNSIDGYRIRNAASLKGQIVFGGFTASARAGAFLVANEYQNLADGSTPGKYGFTQRADIEYGIGNFSIALLVAVEQRFNGSWTNEYTSKESIGYRLSENATISFSHTLMSSLLDTSTGYYAPIRAADGRDSEIALTLELSI